MLSRLLLMQSKHAEEKKRVTNIATFPWKMKASGYPLGIQWGFRGQPKIFPSVKASIINHTAKIHLSGILVRQQIMPPPLHTASSSTSTYDDLTIKKCPFLETLTDQTVSRSVKVSPQNLLFLTAQASFRLHINIWTRHRENGKLFCSPALILQPKGLKHHLHVDKNW